MVIALVAGCVTRCRVGMAARARSSLPLCRPERFVLGVCVAVEVLWRSRGVCMVVCGGGTACDHGAGAYSG